MEGNSVRTTRRGRLMGMERPEMAAKAPLQRLCAAESRLREHTAPFPGADAAVAGRNPASVENRKTLRL